MSADTAARRAEVAVPPLAFVRLQSQAAAEHGSTDLQPRQAAGSTVGGEQAFDPCAPDETVLQLRILGFEGKSFGSWHHPDVVCTKRWCCCRQMQVGCSRSHRCIKR